MKCGNGAITVKRRQWCVRKSHPRPVIRARAAEHARQISSISFTVQAPVLSVTALKNFCRGEEKSYGTANSLKNTLNIASLFGKNAML